MSTLKGARYLLMGLTLLTGYNVSAQVKSVVVTKAQLPKSVVYKGKLVKALKYTDKAGEHLVLTTETGETQHPNSESGDGRDAALYAYHYLVTNNTYKATWQVYDFVNDCPVDINANFVSNTLQVTDINNNGIAEVWLMYKTMCHGDVSPSDMKIIMYEGEKKFAMRGRNKVKLSAKEYEGGEYSFDQAFKSAPAGFRKYAAALWNKNILETWK